MTASLPGNGRRRLMSNIAQRSKRNEKQKNSKRKEEENGEKPDHADVRA